MVTRVNCSGTFTEASIYNGLKYFSAVTAPEEETLAAQTEAILQKYDAMLEDRKHIVTTFVMLDPTCDSNEFLAVWNTWIPYEHAPAFTFIKASLPEGIKVAVSMNVALEDSIQRFRLSGTTDMLIRYGGVAYFSGRSIDGEKHTLAEQTRAVMRSYDRLLDLNGLRKENILSGNIFVQDIEMQDEYEQVWIGWTHIGHKPAGTMVEGKPVDPNHQLELGLTFADSEQVLDIYRHNPGHNCCRFVKYNHVAYFTGNVCMDPNAKDLYDHTKNVMAKLEQQMVDNGMKKENVILCNAYIADIEQKPLFEKAWDEWVTPGDVPTKTVCGTKMLDKEFLIEFTLTVAYE